MQNEHNVLINILKTAFATTEYFSHEPGDFIEHVYNVKDNTHTLNVAVLESLQFKHVEHICGFQNGEIATLYNSTLQIGAFVNEDYIVIICDMVL